MLLILRSSGEVFRKRLVNTVKQVWQRETEDSKYSVTEVMKLISVGFGSIWIRVYTVNGTVHDESCFMISGEELVEINRLNR
jgi:hypothetical protein